MLICKEYQILINISQLQHLCIEITIRPLVRKVTFEYMVFNYIEITEKQSQFKL